MKEYMNLPLKFLMSTLFLIGTNASAQTLVATIGEVNRLSVSIPNQNSSKCAIEIAFPDGSTEQLILNRPNYIASFAFTPDKEGYSQLSWAGKRISRPFTAQCEGGGRLSVYGLPSSQVRIQRWIELENNISDKQRACIGAGLKLMNLDFAKMPKEIGLDVNQPSVKNIRSRCERFADYVLKKNKPCIINYRKSACDEYFNAKTSLGNSTKISEDDILSYIFNNEIEVRFEENNDAKNAIEKSEFEEALKFEAYKKSPQYRKDMAAAKINFMKLMNRGFSENCEATENARFFRSRNNELVAYEVFYNGKEPTVYQIMGYNLIDKDLISFSMKLKGEGNDSSSNWEYKFTEKTFQVYNEKFVRKTIDKDKETPILQVCDKKSEVGVLVENELSGKAGALRKQAQKEEHAKRAIEAQLQSERNAAASKAIKISKGTVWEEGWRTYVSYLYIQPLSDDLVIEKIVMNKGRCNVQTVPAYYPGSPIKVPYGGVLKVILRIGSNDSCNLLDLQIVTNLGTSSYSFN